MQRNYDVIVVGAGHAGCDAAPAAAQMGTKVLLITMNMHHCSNVLQPSHGRCGQRSNCKRN